MQKSTNRLRIALPFAALAMAATAHAQFTPLPLTPESFAYDIVVEKEALHPFTPATTASFDGGTANTGFTLYEQGYNLDAFDTGLPAAGTTATSVDFPDHSFGFAADFAANNALMIDTNTTTGTLTFTTPAAFSSLSFLGAAGHGPVTVSYTVHFEDGSNESGTFDLLDWFNGATPAIVAAGRITANTGGFSDVGSGNPRLFLNDVALANTTSPVESVDFTFQTGANDAHAILFAVSGSTGADFSPVAVSGFNQDVIVEATAGRRGRVLASEGGPEATTATMDAAAINTGYTWYEQGYATNAPTTGLPAAGTTLTNQAASDHVYRLPASYAANNAIIIDAGNPTANIALSSPVTASALSFLVSSGGGTVTIDYVANHEDGSTSTGSLLVPDWFGGQPYAFTTRGRVSADSGVLDAVGSDNPRFYSVDVSLANSGSPVTSIDLTYNTGNGHAAIMALSGAAGAVRPIFETQPASVVAFAGTPVELTANVTGAAPITFQFQRNVNGTYVNVANGNGVSGANTSTLTFSNPTLADIGSFILVAANSAGRSTSLVANINILSSEQDVTSPADVIELVDGTTPAGEPAANSFDNTTTKYLNFGTDGNTAAPFVGPVGVTVTPAIGSTVLTGIRFYTANDAVDRDPADFVLEGSIDGENFTRIAGGPLNLPTARNAAGQELNALTQAIQEVNFSNTAGYTTYRIMFTNVRNNAGANSMQIGEIELLGTEGTGTVQTSLSIAKSGDDEVTISWTGGAGTLQSAPTVLGPWTDVGATNPVTLPTTGDARFFRVRQ